MHHFDIFFAGKLAPEADPEQAREAIGKMFKLQGKPLDKLFSGTPMRIKKAVDVDTANRYRKAFLKAGALIDIVPRENPQAEPDTGDQQPAPAAPLSTDSSATAESANSPLSEMTLLPPKTGSLEDCAPLVQPQAIPDITWMKMDMPGIDLDDTPPVASKQVDISELDMSEPNSGTLEDCKIERPAQPIPDISDMTMSEANSGSLEDCIASEAEQPIPDISHLKLVPPEDETGH